MGTPFKPKPNRSHTHAYCPSYPSPPQVYSPQYVPPRTPPQVYSPAGRRLLPTLRLGAPPSLLYSHPLRCTAPPPPPPPQVYSPAGRRLLPTIHLGGAIACMESEGRLEAPRAVPLTVPLAPECGWKLLVVTVDGRLSLWDLRHHTCVLETSLAPLLASGQSRGVRKCGDWCGEVWD